MIFIVGFILVFHVNLGWAETELNPLPESVTIGDTTYEIAQRTSMPREITSRLPSAYRFQKERPLELLDDSFQYWLDGDEFLRSPGGKFALPFKGSAPFVGYIDLARKEFIYFGEAFPPTGERRGKGGHTRYEWTGLLDEVQREPAVLWLFVRRWDRTKRSFSSHRVSIPLAAPESIRVEMMKHAVVERVFAQAKNEILCEVVDDRNRNWARISTDTWAILAEGKPSKEYGHLGRAVYAPGQGEIYVVYSLGGLVIFDAINGTEKAHHEEVGHYFNAYTFGATFDPGGSVAVVSTPYRHRIALIDVKSRRILSEYKTEAPLAGVLFDEKELKAYAYQTFLPYE